MIIKLAQLLDVEKPLADLMNQDLPLKLSYKLGKMVKKAGDEMKEFYKLRDDLVKKLGTKEPGVEEKYTVPEDNRENFAKQIMELAEIAVDFPEFEPISISDFDGIDVKLSPIQMAALSDFFKD